MELSEEEKEAIEYIKEFRNEVFEGVGNKSIMAKNINILLNLIDKQKNEIEEWFEIADNILRATNDYGNITIGDIPKYIAKQQKEIEEKNIAINKMSKDISRQLEEIEEKSTIIMAGAEKVKQLEKGNQSLMESRKKWKNRYYKEKAKNKDYISKDKIRKLIAKYTLINNSEHIKGMYTKEILALKELLEEN